VSNRGRSLRPARQIEHAVVYRRENEFASHPDVRGFSEDARGHLTTTFSVATVDYAGDPGRLAHVGLVRGAGGLSELAPVDFTDRNVLVSNFNHQYLREDPLSGGSWDGGYPRTWEAAPGADGVRFTGRSFFAVD
jgi:hypothetical protein